MTSILSFYYTLKENTTKETIRNLVNEWIQTGQYYNFEETILSEDELESAVRSVKGENQSTLSYCQAYDASKKVRYLAFRMETRDASNLTWIADVIFSESDNLAPGILVNLNRRVTDPQQPCDCSQRIKYPSLIKLLFDKNLVQDAVPLPLGILEKVSSLTGDISEKLCNVFQKKVRTDFPLLFIYAPNLDLNCQEVYFQENLDLSIQNLLQISSSAENPYRLNSDGLNSDGLLRMVCIFSRVMHVYVADTKEELQCWNQFHRIPAADYPYIEFYYPWLNLDYHIPLGQFRNFNQLYQYLIFLLQYCRQGLNPSFPDWNSLQDLISLVEAENSNESYYLHMNQNIANAMQIRRKELHMTQGDLAEKIGTTKMLISRLERLQTIKVRRRMIRQLEMALSLATGSLEKLSEYDHTSTSAISTASTPSAALNTTDMSSAAFEHSHSSEQDHTVSTHPVYCHMCGKTLLSESRYCRWCGTRI